MMLVKTVLKASPIHGLGVFAEEPISKGAVIWKFVPGFDLKLDDRQAARLPKQAREHLSTYAYRSKKSGRYVLCMDNGKYFNHSDSPNTSNRYLENEEEVVTFAGRDIPAGEELTCDYGELEENGGKR